MFTHARDYFDQIGDRVPGRVLFAGGGAPVGRRAHMDLGVAERQETAGANPRLCRSPRGARPTRPGLDVRRCGRRLPQVSAARPPLTPQYGFTLPVLDLDVSANAAQDE
jgi:hypothetical protein